VQSFGTFRSVKQDSLRPALELTRGVNHLL
jgi:hypothetical protein